MGNYRIRKPVGYITLLVICTTWWVVGCSPLLSSDGGSEDVGAMTHSEVEDSRYLPIREIPTKGALEAPVVVVEFADFNDCTVTGHHQALERLVDERADQIQLAVRHAPSRGNQSSMDASLAVEAARNQGYFWEMRRLYAQSCSGDSEGIRRSARDRGVKFARQLDLDLERYWVDVHSPETVEVIQRDQRLAMALDVGSRTSFFVGGQRWEPVGETSIEDWDRQIDAAWQRGLELLGQGVEWSQIFAEDVRRRFEADRLLSERRGATPAPVADPEIKDSDLVVKESDDYLVTVVAFVNFDGLASGEALYRLDEMIRDHGDETRIVVKFGWHPLYGEGLNSARAVIAADRQQRGWEMAMELRDRPDLDRGVEEFAEIADRIGVEDERFRSDFGDPQLDELLFDDRLEMERLGIGATPAIYANGLRFSGGEDQHYLAGFISWFEEAHDHARRFGDEHGGLRGAELYRRLIDEHGLQTDVPEEQ